MTAASNHCQVHNVTGLAEKPALFGKTECDLNDVVSSRDGAQWNKDSLLRLSLLHHLR